MASSPATDVNEPMCMCLYVCVSVCMCVRVVCVYVCACESVRERERERAICVYLYSKHSQEKLIIMQDRDQRSLNKRSELMNICRHKSKFKLDHHKD